MKTKNVSNSLITLLNTSTNLMVANLITITLTDSTILYYTSCELSITIGSITYKSLNLKRGQIGWKKGISVDTLSMEIYPDINTDLVGAVSMNEAFCNGTFDGAYLQIDKAFFPTWTQPPLVLPALFIGRVDVNEVSQTIVKLTVKTVTELLNINCPKKLLQCACGYTLYGSGCNVNAATYTFNSSVLTGSTKTSIICGLIKPTDYFIQGVMTFTSGKNYNLKRTVKAYSSGLVTLIHPFQYTPAIGDTFSITIGCQKTVSDCKGKFNNLDNFGGQRFIPLSETIV